MNYNYYENFIMNDEVEERIWEDCEFLFDSSALLALYYYSTEAQNDIFGKTLDKIKSRLWIPGHAGYEYFKNRKKVINELIDEKYEYIDENYLSPVEDHIEKIQKTINGISEFTKKNEKRPHIDREIIENFKNKSDEYQEEFKSFKESLNQKLKDDIDNIKLLLEKDNDHILEQITDYFQFGKEYSTNEIFKIIGEGEIRYNNTWPPGYKDEKDKDGMQIYGDLIIWKQIIDYAKEKNNPIIFITNDTTKGDWCYEDQRGRVKAPREELIKEIYDEAGVNFWMYDLSQFVFKANNLLDTDLTDETLEEVEHISNEYRINRKSSNLLKKKTKKSIYYKSIINWVKKNLDVREIQYSYETNKYVDFVFYGRDNTKNGVIIEKVPNNEINRLSNIIDWLYSNTRLDDIKNIYLFLVSENQYIEFSINKEELQHFKNRYFYILTGYLGEKGKFYINNDFKF